METNLGKVIKMATKPGKIDISAMKKFMNKKFMNND
jgi:hypothetical protein